MRISDWSSYVCSADLRLDVREPEAASMKRLAEIQAVVDVPERVSNALLVPWRRAALQGPQDARDGHAGFHHSGHREHEAAAGGQAIDRPWRIAVHDRADASRPAWQGPDDRHDPREDRSERGDRKSTRLNSSH